MCTDGLKIEMMGQRMPGGLKNHNSRKSLRDYARSVLQNSFVIMQVDI